MIPDIDGFAVLFNPSLYLAVHHTFAHTLVFGIAVSAIFALFVKRRALGFAVFICSFSAHLGADVFGTWGVPVFAPFISTSFSTSPYLSDDNAYAILYLVVLIATLSGAVAILLLKRRTPMEFLSKTRDRVMVDFLILPFTSRCYVCRRRALFQCDHCARTVCGTHIARRTKRILCVECENRENARYPPSESN